MFSFYTYINNDYNNSFLNSRWQPVYLIYQGDMLAIFFIITTKIKMAH